MKNVAGFHSLDFDLEGPLGFERFRRGLGIRLVQKDVCVILLMLDV